VVTVDWVLDWRLDLLTTLTHYSWLHLIIVPSLISTIYKSLQHMFSLFSLLCLCQLFPGKGFNSGDSSASTQTSLLAGSQLHRLSLLFTDPPYNCLTTLSQPSLQIWWTSEPVLVITPRHGRCRKHRSLLYSNRFRGNMFVCEGVIR
jgi:hypothetical protein